MVQDVKGCARCGGDHPGLVFKPLTKAMEPEQAAGRKWQMWAPCPSNGEPIMMQVDQLDEKNRQVFDGLSRGHQREDGRGRE